MKFIVRSMVFLLVLALLSGCMMGKPPIPYHGALSGNMVKHPVTVVRDAEGVPHIFADEPADLFFGLGYTMAQDRLFQMDMYRHVALGRLSEWFGNLSLGKGVSLVEIDMLLKCFEIGERTEAAVDRIPAETGILMREFVRGINRFIEDCGEEAPVEYRWMGVTPEPWRPSDVMAIPELFGIGLTLINLSTEILYEAMTHVVGADMTQEFFRLYGGRPPPVPALEAPKGYAGDPLDALRGVMQAGDLLRGMAPRGSNNWVVAGRVTESGAPILGNDPHVPLGMAPSFWYHAHLQGGGFSVEGILYPGYPTFGAAWNGDVAWGITNMMADQMDLYRERLDPADPDLYETAEGWRRFETRQVRCGVRFSRDREFTLKKGVHGFLVPKKAMKNKISKASPWMLDPTSLRYVETDPAAYFEGQVLLMRARTSLQVKEALERIGTGPTAYNYVWADRKSGDIGYHAAGRIPIRPDGQGCAAKAGWRPDVAWRGYVPFGALPAGENPADGILVTANNQIASPDYPWYISGDYARPYRAIRIRQLLDKKENRSLEGFERIQADVFNLAAEPVLRVLRDAFSTEKTTETLNEKEREAWDVLMNWDLETRADSAGAALFEVFSQELLETAFAKKLGPELAEMALGSNMVAAKVIEAALDDPDNPWFEQEGVSALDSRDHVFRTAFRRAAKICRKSMGRDPARWSWGRLHALTLGHPFGRIPLLGGPFRIETLPYPGDNDTVNGGYFIFAGGRYPVVVGAASRFVADLSQPTGAWFNCSTGMSGDPSSEYFKNLTPGWYDGKYFQTSLAERPEDVPSGKRLVLEP